MIIKHRRRTVSTPAVPKQLEVQSKVGKKEEVVKISSLNKVKKILEEIEEETSHEE